MFYGTIQRDFLPRFVQVKAKRIGTVADTILQFYADRYPKTRSRLAFAYWLGLLKNSIAQFDHILTVSEFSKRCILQFCERHGINCPACHCDLRRRHGGPPCRGNGAKENYVVHLASSLPHKKTEWLLTTWDRLRSGGVKPPFAFGR